MQLTLINELDSLTFEGERVGPGLSGGINSAAVLVYLSQMKNKPKDLYLFHTNLLEHSSDTLLFVNACLAYAKEHFNVIYEQQDHSLFAFFESSKMIPHPMVSPCTRILKVIPMAEFKAKHGITIDLVGYVREEKNRITRQLRAAKGEDRKAYLISHLQNEDCFKLVKKALGWYPWIYDILWTDERIKNYVELCRRNERDDPAFAVIEKYSNQGHGYRKQKRVFAHNNCLPCKNFQAWQYEIMALFYPDRAHEAQELAKRIGSHWGRGDGVECAVCTFD